MCDYAITVYLEGLEVDTYDQPIRECHLEVVSVLGICDHEYSHISSTVVYSEGDSFTVVLSQLKTYKENFETLESTKSKIVWIQIAGTFLLSFFAFSALAAPLVIISKRKFSKKNVELSKKIFVLNLLVRLKEQISEMN